MTAVGWLAFGERKLSELAGLMRYEKPERESIERVGDGTRNSGPMYVCMRVWFRSLPENIEGEKDRKNATGFSRRLYGTTCEKDDRQECR